MTESPTPAPHPFLSHVVITDVEPHHVRNVDFESYGWHFSTVRAMAGGHADIFTRGTATLEMGWAWTDDLDAPDDRLLSPLYIGDTPWPVSTIDDIVGALEQDWRYSQPLSALDVANPLDVEQIRDGTRGRLEVSADSASTRESTYSLEESFADDAMRIDREAEQDAAARFAAVAPTKIEAAHRLLADHPYVVPYDEITQRGINLDEMSLVTMADVDDLTDIPRVRRQRAAVDRGLAVPEATALDHDIHGPARDVHPNTEQILGRVQKQLNELTHNDIRPDSAFSIRTTERHSLAADVEPSTPADHEHEPAEVAGEPEIDF